MTRIFDMLPPLDLKHYPVLWILEGVTVESREDFQKLTVQRGLSCFRK